MITTSTKKLMLAAGAVLLVAVGLLMPFDAFATNGIADGGQDLNMQAKQISTQLANAPRLIAMACYVIGTFFAVRALFALKGFIEAPDDNPLPKVLGFAAVAVLLILLPWVLSVITKSTGAKNVNVKSASDSFVSQGTEGFQ